MPDPLKFSRWRRLEGVHRIMERRLPTHQTEPQRLTLYLPGAALDQAEKLAAYTGHRTLQAYCEALLLRAIAVEENLMRGQAEAAAAGARATVESMATDPETMEEWSSLTTIAVEHDEASDRPSEKPPVGPAEPSEQNDGRNRERRQP